MVEFLAAVFDYTVAPATVHNVVQSALVRAAEINEGYDLSAIKVGAHDEIYQAGKPVFVGVDTRSTFCYLLAAAENCDETSWGVELLDLADRGLAPKRTIADGGKALRAGQNAAWPDVPCHGDVWHAQRDLGRVATFLNNRKAAMVKTRKRLEVKLARPRSSREKARLSAQLEGVRAQEQAAVALADDIATLAAWMRSDVLSITGPSLEHRRETFDFIVEELRSREALCPHRITPVRKSLELQCDQLLGFAVVLDERFEDIATRLRVPVFLCHATSEALALPETSAARWKREAQLFAKLGSRFRDLKIAVQEALDDTPRASSLVENLNSRLRNYFFLRKQVGPGYLKLLQFFLNHRVYQRSRRPERAGKSPAELLTGLGHAHWLELLGYTRFKRA